MASNTSTVDISALSPYGYVPSFSVGVLFVVLFSVATLGHFVHALYRRTWFLVPTIILAGVGEILGWTGRVWSSKNVLNSNAFMIQICTTIIAPTPLLAANFIIFGRLVRRLGTSYSLLKPKLYTTIFLSCDFIALCLQGLGGGLASTANTQSAADLGSNIMLAGIVFQLVVIVCFTALTFVYWRRYHDHRPVSRAPDAQSTPRGIVDNRLQLLIYGLVFNTTCLFIRAIYRIAELGAGWLGTVMTTQWLFCVFDGAMIVLAIYTFLLLPPGLLLTPASLDAKLERTSVQSL